MEGAAAHAEQQDKTVKATASGAEGIVLGKNHLELAALADGEEQIVLETASEIIQTAEEQDGKIQAHAEIAERFKLIATDVTTQDELNV